MKDQRKAPPSVEILFLRHSKARRVDTFGRDVGYGHALWFAMHCCREARK